MGGKQGGGFHRVEVGSKFMLSIMMMGVLFEDGLIPTWHWLAGLHTHMRCIIATQELSEAVCNNWAGMQWP